MSKPEEGVATSSSSGLARSLSTRSFDGSAPRSLKRMNSKTSVESFGEGREQQVQPPTRGLKRLSSKTSVGEGHEQPSQPNGMKRCRIRVKTKMSSAWNGYQNAQVDALSTDMATSIAKASGSWPKAPKKAYAIFVEKQKRKRSDIKPAELGAQWKKLGTSDRYEYVTGEQADGVRYNDEVSNFQKSDVFATILRDARKLAERKVKGEAVPSVSAWLKEQRLEALKKKKAEAARDRLAMQLARGVGSAGGFPTAPSSAYSLFMAAKKSDFDGAKAIELSMKVAAAWKALSDEEKAAYIKDAREKQAEYLKVLEEFRKTDAFKAAQADADAFLRENEEKRSRGEEPQAMVSWQKKKRLEALEKAKAEKKKNTLVLKLVRSCLRSAGAPKMPKSQYELFSQSVREEVAEEGGSFSEVAKKIGALWKEATPEAKKPFQEQAAEDSKRYIAELEAFCTTDEYRSFAEDVNKWKGEVEDEKAYPFRKWYLAKRKERASQARAEDRKKALEERRAAKGGKKAKAAKPAKAIASAAKAGTISTLPPLDVDPFWDAIDDNSEFDPADMLLNDRRVVAAAKRGAVEFVKRAMEDLQSSSSLFRQQSTKVQLTSLHYALLRKDLKLLEVLAKELEPRKPPEGHPLAINPHQILTRQKLQRCELQPMSTGFASGRAYRAKKLRKVNQGRGGKEGLQAFVHDLQGGWYEGPRCDLEMAFQWVAGKGMDLQTMKICIEIFGGPDKVLSPALLLGDAVRSGQLELARELTKEFGPPNDMHGLNANHGLALQAEVTDEELKEAVKRKASVTKKAYENFSLTPVHLACINPNKRALEAFLGVLGAGAQAEDLTKDESGRTLLHYAAACQTADNVSVLLGRGYSPHRVDNEKFTPLMIACIMNRPECVSRLMSAAADPLQRGEGEKTCFHMAVESDALQALEALVAHKGEDEETPTVSWDRALTSSQRSALHDACAVGNHAMVELLLTAIPRALNKGDKQNCTPLIYAVMNGHTKLASVLLAKNAVVDAPDTSNSTPLHYALAYGWRDAAKLLVDRGHDTNPQNDWRTSPIGAAVLKGHFAQVAWFASLYPIDPNEQDENGRTLLCRACENLTNKQWRFLLHVLVEKRGADVNLADGQGNLPICQAVKACSADKELNSELEVSLKLLCNMRADVGARASGGSLKGQSALSLALQGTNQSLLCVMLQSGAGVAGHGRGETLLHLLATSCCSADSKSFDASVLAVVKNAVSIEALQEMATTPNQRGLLPVHCAVKRLNEVLQNIEEKGKAPQSRSPQRQGFGGGMFGQPAAPFGGGGFFGQPSFGKPTPVPTENDDEERLSTEEKLGRARQSFQDFITWVLKETKATLEAPSIQLEKPWEDFQAAHKVEEAPGPMPLLGSDVEIVAATLGSDDKTIMWKQLPDKRVVAAKEAEWRNHDLVLGMSTPLMLLITGGDEEAVRWFLTLLGNGTKKLQEALKATNIYGVTPLISALHCVGGPRTMSADVFRSLAAAPVLKEPLYNGRTALHLAVAGGSVGWANHKARISSSETLLGWVRFRITKIYESVNPNNLSKIPEFLEQNKADLYGFYEKVCKKYNMRVEAKPSIKESSKPEGQSQGSDQDPEASAQIIKGFICWDPSSSNKSYDELRWESQSNQGGKVATKEDGSLAVVPSPGTVAFEVVLASAVEAGVVNAVDGGGVTPLHLAVNAAPVEEPVLESLKDGGSFSVAYATALAIKSATAEIVKETGQRKVPAGDLLFLAHSKAELLGLPSCRITFGRWYFEISGLARLSDGKVGWHTAPRVEDGIVKDVTRSTLFGLASISELIKEANRVTSPDTIGVALDFDEGEVSFSVDGTWLKKRSVKRGFGGCVCPVVFGRGECRMRIKVENFKHNTRPDQKSYWPISHALPSGASRRRAIQAMLVAKADVAITTGKTSLTALQLAVESRDTGVVQLLCDAKSNPNALVQKWRAPLLIAAEANDLPLASALLAAGAIVDIPDVRASAQCPGAEMYMQQRHYPHTALHWVAGNSSAAAFVELLVKAKADVNAPAERRTLSTRKSWLPLPHVDGDPAELGSQADRGLKINDRIALHAAAAIELLGNLGAQSKVLSAAQLEAAKHAGDGFVVLRGHIVGIMGESRYRLGGGDFEKVLQDSQAPPLSNERVLEVSRKMLLWHAEVDFIRVDLVRPVHLAAECNSNESLSALLVARADPAAVDERQGNLALHFAAGHCNLKALQSLFKAGTPLDVADQTPQQKTPLRVAVLGALAGTSHGMETMQAILAARATVDLPGGSDGRSALHLGASARNLPIITELLKHGANANMEDPYKRTSLHDAIVAAGPFEPAFDIERVLLNAGANVNALDHHGRTPLHYAFVKPGNMLEMSVADPIETVTSLCAVEGIQVDIVDVFGSTPMLYAARRSCTISSLFLAKRGASLATRDMHGNDILGCALGGKHHEYAITLLSQNAGEVNMPMHHMYQKEVSEDGAKRRRLEAGPPNSLFFEAVKNSWLGLAYLLLDHGVPFHRAIQDALELGRFRLVLTLLSKVNPAQNEMLRRADDSGRTLVHVLADFPKTLPAEATEIAVELSKRGVPAATYDSQDRAPLHCAAIYGHLALMQWLLSAAGIQACLRKSKDGVTPFHSVCPRHWLQQHGEVSHRQAMQMLLPHSTAAVNELFPVVLLDEKNQPYTVMNVALVNVAAAAFVESTKLLLEARANVNLADGTGETPLCAALRGHNAFKLAEILCLSKADPNKREGKGNSPLCLAVRAPSNPVELVRALVRFGARISDDPTFQSGSSLVVEALQLPQSRKKYDLLEALLELKASPDQGVDAKGRPALVLSVEEKDSHAVRTLLKAGTKAACMDTSGRSALLIAVMTQQIDIMNKLLESQADVNSGRDKHNCSALFHAVKWGNESIVRSLLKVGASANKAGTDKHGCTPLSVAVLSNAGMIADALLDAKADPMVADHHGRNAAHHCVQPLAHGSFESTWLAAAIAKAPRGKDAFTAADAKGVRAVDLAAMQGSGRLARQLSQIGIAVPEANPAAIQALCMVSEPAHEKPLVDKHSRVELEHFEATAKTVPIPVHKAYAMSGNNEVWTEDGDEYDAMLFKVDLKRDEMRFYHIQLIHETNKDLFVLFTRWGEIGDTTGQFQKTPAANKEEALKSYEKVFKEKTGNVFATRATTFERKPGKYQLLKRRRAVATTEELLKPFDPPMLDCSLSLAVRRTVDAICDEKKVAQALRHLGINSQSMPFGSLSRETLDAAKELLGEIRKAIEEVKAISAKPFITYDPKERADRAKERNDAREKILELSSRYYELIPRGAGATEVAKPLEREDLLSKEFQVLMDLSEVSVGVQVILGSLHCQKTQHPLDYCYQALQINLEQVDAKSDEFDFLLKYAQRTSPGNQPQAAVPEDFNPRKRKSRNSDTITAIYRLSRKGESERFSSGASELPNHRLLWHGSAASNMIGILSQGLRVAPPEAPVSGYMFGKGVYFADMYQKSRAYCRTGSNETAYMILCEVALGNIYPTRQPMYMEEPRPGCNSTWGVGSNAPDWKNQIIEPGGAGVPSGQATPQGQDYCLGHNEFIVYDASQIRMRYLIELNNFECPEEARKRKLQEEQDAKAQLMKKFART